MNTIPQSITFSERLKVGMYSLVVLLLPQVSSSIGNGSKHNWSLAAMATAVWAAVWAGKKAKQTCSTHQANMPTGADCCDSGGGSQGCCTACFSACAAACCESMCHATCDICTQTMCGWCKGRDDSSWTALWIVLFCLVLLGGVIYLILKLGVA
jgi:hypothetical protein